jgi:hypothetical protein
LARSGSVLAPAPDQAAMPLLPGRNDSPAPARVGPALLIRVTSRSIGTRTFYGSISTP